MQTSQSISEPIADTLEKPSNKKCYIGCKVILAEPMTQEEWLRSQNKWQENQETYGDGYKVTYPDNYVSWSPKNVFEIAYREITYEEKWLIKK